MQNFFKNKIAVITGGTSGIGKALATSLLQQGAKVAMCARNKEALQAMRNNFPPDKFFACVADVSDEMQCKNFIQQSANYFGAIDLLINNAGMSMRALFKDLENMEVLKKIMDINFWGTVYCTHYALPYLLQSKGTVAGVSSIAGYRGLPGRTGYSASKFAMQGFLESLRTELLFSGINVMWVCPGFTASNIRNTALNQSGTAQEETPLKESKLMSAEKVAQEILKAIGKRKRTLVLTSQGKLTIWMNRFFGKLTDKLVYNHFKKEAGSPL